MRRLGWLFVLLSMAYACRQSAPADDVQFVENKQVLPPNERFGPLFDAVQSQAVFPDGKTFVDCEPKFPTDQIMAAYFARKDEAGFDLKAFVAENFNLPPNFSSGYVSDTRQSLSEHINALWPVLTRQPDASGKGSLVALPRPYIVPGGRFREIYYWDSYFTMLGLQAASQVDMVDNMVNNFAYLIDSIGFIPNGNRTYYLTRSQPPFFAFMVDVLAQMKGEDTYRVFLPQLAKEYDFWMDGLTELSPGTPAVKHVVRMPDGSILNRYFDRGNYPRAESYRQDVETAKRSGRPQEEVYAHLRAGAESGWDFSSRWLADGKTLATIQTTDIIPVDLNALLYHLEIRLAKAFALAGNATQAEAFTGRAQQRKAAIQKYCWNAGIGYFVDYNWKTQKYTGITSLAGAYPLFTAMATPEQAAACARVLSRDFLQAGGLVTTLNNTGQQWDYPNAWAPLQWIAIRGLLNYGEQGLADNIRGRWISLNERVYRKTGKMLEKYNAVDMSLEAGGGEYPVQDGFGWTNGVLLQLLGLQ